jgi:TolA-binding protein
MKRMQAIFAAALITAVIAVGIVAVGVNAAVNTNSVAPSDSPNAAATGAANPNLAANVQTAEAQINQLKSLITQYQAREKQYQQQLSAENTQLQQLQSILAQLQQAGVIRIGSDGTITLGRARGFGDDFRGGSTNGNSNSGGNTFR